MYQWQDRRDFKTYPDTTTLHWAALLGLEGVCRWLILEGSDVNRGSSLGTPLDCLLSGVTAIRTHALFFAKGKWSEDHIIDMYGARNGAANDTIQTKAKIANGSLKLD